MSAKRAWPLRIALVALAVVLSGGHALAAPTGEDAVRAALDGWRLSEAEAAIKSLPTGDARELLAARAELMRSDAKAAVKRLDPLVARTPGEAGYEARVVLGQALQALGKKQEAFAVLDVMADDYTNDAVTSARGLMWLGVGLMLTDYPKNAHRVFREALDKDPGLGLAKRLWADLYASKYDYRKADPLYKEVGADVMAAVGRARVAIESDRAFAEAVELMTPIHATAPECVPCHNVLALVDLHNELPEASARRLEEHSLKVAPADPEALALLGAAYYLMDDTQRFAAVERRALAANSKAAGFYTTVADHAEREHRYGEAIALLEKALVLDPENWVALGMIGTGYSRMGEDDKAKEKLDQSFEGDPYNVRVYNLLAHFYDKADKRYTWIDAAPMRIRVDNAEAKVLERVVPALVQEAEKALTKKYGVRPAAPLHIEIFKNTETFAVRSTGLPGLAAHGICFGHVITARSPSAGDFNWGEVLWHELAHVYHIQITKGRVPRWFTEGLAVLESSEARPAWQREEDHELDAAFRNGKLRGVGDFNLAFTQAKSIGEILVAYYQAYQVTRFIRDEWGFPKMRRMLELWGDKKGTAEVFKSALGVETGEFDKRFFAWLDKQLAYLAAAYPFDLKRYRSAPDERASDVMKAAESGDSKAKAEAAMMALSRGDKVAAAKWANEALKGDDVPSARYVRALLGVGDVATRAAAILDWEALRAAGKAGVEGLGLLAVNASEAGNHKTAALRWAEAAALDPKSSWALSNLEAALDKAGSAAEAHAVRKRELALEQADADLAVKVLGEMVGFGASKNEVAKLAEQVLHVAPFSLPVNLARARALAAVGLTKEAKAAAELALSIDPANAEALKLKGP